MELRTIDPNRKVSIVGFAGTTRGLVPYNDPQMEVWSLNNAWQFVERWDRWFEMHALDIIASHFMRPAQDAVDGKAEQRPSERWEWLTRSHGKPIYMLQRHEQFPDSVAFPREELNRWFAAMGADRTGFYALDYYTSTPAQMLALAIYEGYGEIHLYGIDMLQDEEYYYQRAGCEYYAGFARGRGQKVYIPDRSALCKAGYVYGYSEPPSKEQYAPILDFISAQKAEAEQQVSRAKDAAHIQEGRRLAFEEMVALLAPLAGVTESSGVEAISAAVASLKAVVERAGSGRTTAAVERDKALNAANLHEGARQMGDAVFSWMTHYSRGGLLNAPTSISRASA